jgi:hypothetical protein
LQPIELVAPALALVQNTPIGQDTDAAGEVHTTKPGGWDVACYPSDITKEAIDAYRKSQGK